MPAKDKFPLLATAVTAYRDVFGNPANTMRMITFSWMLMFLLIDIPTHFIGKEITAAVEAQKATQASNPKPELPPDMPPEVAAKAAEIMANFPQEPPRIKTEHIIASFALNLLQVMIIFSFAVALYRKFLRGDAREKPIFFRFGKQEWDYSWTSVKAGFAVLPVLLLVAGLAFSLIVPQGEVQNLETYVLIAVGVAIGLYLQARLSIAYPLTVMGETQAPVRKSWKMTGKYGVQLAIGQVLIVVPMTLLLLGLVFTASALVEHFFADALNPKHEFPLAATLLLKAIGSLFTLSVFAVLAAFQARAYRFLVKSEE